MALNLLNKPLKIGPLSSVVNNSLEHVVHVARFIVSIRCIAMYNIAPSWTWQVFFLFSATLLNAVMSVSM